MKINFVKKVLIILFVSLFSISCQRKEEEKPVLQNIYRTYMGERNNFKVWVVDGALIRETIFNEFIYGGNDERYIFVPEGEMWIDNSISAEEYETTLQHEINERNLMRKFGMTYFDAHDSSLSLELQMRAIYKSESEKHESLLPLMMPIDFDSTQEIESLPEKIKLKNIYRVPFGERNGVKIWIVDGYAVRRDVYPDFGFSGNGYAYMFIPKDEIWIDGEITCEEIEYSISLELKERELMSAGKYYDDAYLEAVKISDAMRKSNREMIRIKKLIVPSVLLRDTGSGTGRN
ncbi:MAG: hypothetical protein PHN88_08775 [Ignavibacteria bacterium]|nr:hypothetical protein [Ignavibacteria bacterium]